MAPTLMATKIGMTRVYTEGGASVPVTVLALGPCYVTQIKTPEKDGYAAVQVGYGEIKARNSTIPMISHDMKAGVEPQRHHREFRVEPSELGSFTLGQALTVADMAKVAYVDVIGRSKGKGFQGTMKRHNFSGMEASHGVERKHRSPGSIGGHANERGGSGGPKKGKKMSGHMGAERVTMRNIDVIRIDAERNLMLVKGPVPGSNRGMVIVRPSIRLRTTKATRAKELAG